MFGGIGAQLGISSVSKALSSIMIVKVGKLGLPIGAISEYVLSSEMDTQI